MKRTNINEVAKRYAELDFALICEERYSSLKQIDWVVFAILKNQESLSLHSYEKGNTSYVDEDMNVFIRISQEKLAKLLKTSIPTLRASLKRLEAVELIETIVTGVNKCNKIYCGEPIRTITFEEYFKKIGTDIEADTVEPKPTINVTNVNEMKKAPTVPPAEASENTKDLLLNKNNSTDNIPQNKGNGNGIKCKKEFNPNYNKPNVRRNSFNNGTNNTFTNYEPDELEKLLLESQKGKFK